MTITACKLQLIEYISTGVVIQSLSLYPFQTGNSIMERNIILFLDFVHTVPYPVLLSASPRENPSPFPRVGRVMPDAQDRQRQAVLRRRSSC